MYCFVIALVLSVLKLAGLYEVSWWSIVLIWPVIPVIIHLAWAGFLVVTKGYY